MRKEELEMEYARTSAFGFVTIRQIATEGLSSLRSTAIYATACSVCMNRNGTLTHRDRHK